jgi:hypothetical protein
VQVAVLAKSLDAALSGIDRVVPAIKASIASIADEVQGAYSTKP